jgi:hypothetical protein
MPLGSGRTADGFFTYRKRRVVVEVAVSGAGDCADCQQQEREDSLHFFRYVISPVGSVLLSCHERNGARYHFYGSNEERMLKMMMLLVNKKEKNDEKS